MRETRIKGKWLIILGVILCASNFAWQGVFFSIGHLISNLLTPLGLIGLALVVIGILIDR